MTENVLFRPCYSVDTKMDRKFKTFQPKICYDRPASCLTDKDECDKSRERAIKGTLVHSLVVPKKSARTWTMQKGDLCKITLTEGSQVRLSLSTFLE